MKNFIIKILKLLEFSLVNLDIKMPDDGKLDKYPEHWRKLYLESVEKRKLCK